MQTSATDLQMVPFALRRTRISSTFLFWTAFVLTRPWGATVGDLLTKSHAKGGLDLGTTGSSATLTATLLLLIGYALLVQRRQARLDPVPVR
jgi:uncharacterized membrane-anchored protein